VTEDEALNQLASTLWWVAAYAALRGQQGEDIYVVADEMSVQFEMAQARARVQGATS